MNRKLTSTLVAGVAGGLLLSIVAGAAPAREASPAPASRVVPLVQDQKGQTITGRVVDNSGAPLSAFPVTLLKLNQRIGGDGGGGEKQLVAHGQGKGPKELNDMFTKIDRTETDAEGNFKFENVKPGSYSVQFGDPEKLEAGYIKKGVKVEEGKPADMGEIKLKPQAPRKDDKKGGKKGAR